MKNLIILPKFLRYLIINYLFGLLIFQIFRLVLFFLNFTIPEVSNESTSVILKSFVIGLQFDTVVSGYILALPMLVLILTAFSKHYQMIFKVVNIYIFTLMFIAFFICAADIPFYLYNSARISSIIFNWVADAAVIFKMILEEPSYIIYFFILLAIFFTYLILVRHITKKIIRKVQPQNFNKPQFYAHIIYSMIGVFLIFMAMRGRRESPIKLSHSFFCNNSFYNQLGLNPVFTLFKSIEANQNIDIIKEDIAIENVKKFLKVPDSSLLVSPIARLTLANNSPSKMNIVVVIMESMTTEKMGYYGNPYKLTPFLDSLSKVSFCFENIFTAGKHTYNGIFSTVYSYPAILNEHSLSAAEIKHFSGFPGVLKNEGYKSVYFTAYKESFDNVGVFLPCNYFDRIVSEKDYDKSKIQSVFGVADHVMLDYAIGVFDEIANQNTPFFSTITTASDHGPYIIPEGITFKPKNKEIYKQIVEYSDWALNRFFTIASQKAWFKNTLFVFVADHGASTGSKIYDIQLSFHHTPLIMFSPDTNITYPKVFKEYGCQMDIFPTVMGLLNFSYINNTLGVDLLNSIRPFSYFSDDDKIGCIDNEYFYIYRVNGKESLYKYKTSDPKDYLGDFPNEAKLMRDYATSMTIASRWLIVNNKTGYIPFQP